MSNLNTTNASDSADTDTWASNIEMGAPTAPVVNEGAKDVSLTAEGILEQASPPVTRIQGVTVDQEGVRRATADIEAAKKAGFSLKPPIYQLGRLVNETGVANFRKARMEFEAMPRLGDACEKLCQVIKAEERSDIQVEAPVLWMDNDGLLHVKDDKYPVTERAVEGLGHFITPGGARYLTECPVELRAYNLNKWFQAGYRVDKRATVKANPDGIEYEDMEKTYTPTKVTLRTRKNADAREVYSVVGSRYAAFDTNAVVAQIYKALAAKNIDCRADFTYNGYKSRLDVVFHTPVQPENCVAGEIFRAALCIRTADDGSGSINVSTEIHRNLCLNMLILDQDKILVGSRRHAGKTATIEQKIDEALASAQEKIGYFVKAWDNATVENVLEKYDLGDPREVFRRLVLNRVIAVSGVKTDEMVNRLMAAYEKEPGYSRSAYINAITRASHESEWANDETIDELESTASQLLFAKVWEMKLPDERTVSDVLGGW